jgi:lysyl-tRNA synthetase class 2
MDANPIHVAVAGRMMFKRVMGKASFCNIQDLQGNIQVYVARDAIGTDSYADLKNLISAIFSVWKDLLSEQEQVRFLSMQRR